MSGKLHPAARVSTTTWPGPGAGSGTSRYSSSDGSPHRVATMAFMTLDDTSLAGAVVRRPRRAAPAASGGPRVADELAVEVRPAGAQLVVRMRALGRQRGRVQGGHDHLVLDALEL